MVSRRRKSSIPLIAGCVTGAGALVAVKFLWDAFTSGNNLLALGLLVVAAACAVVAWHSLWRWYLDPGTESPKRARPRSNAAVQKARPKKRSKRRR
jgi:hypothetical protein